MIRSKKMRVGAFGDYDFPLVGADFLRHQRSLVHVAARKCSEQQRFTIRKKIRREIGQLAFIRLQLCCGLRCASAITDPKNSRTKRWRVVNVVICAPAQSFRVSDSVRNDHWSAAIE